MKAKRGNWIWAFAIILALSAVASTSLAEEGVAIVNGAVISKADLDRETNRLRQQRQFSGNPAGGSQPSDIREEALEELIGRELLYQESKKLGIEVGEEIIKKHMATMKARFGSEEEFEDRIAKMNLTEEDFEDEFRRGKAVRQLIEAEVIQKITTSEEDIRNYYDTNPDLFKQPEQVKASHILIKAQPNADESEKDKAREELAEIKRKLDEGGDFAELAKEYSQGPSGPRGGDLGYFGRGQMVKPFEETAFALDAGKVSDTVETRFGYHLIKVFDKKSASPIPYENVKDRIGEILKRQKINEEVKLYAERLKEEASIEKFLPE